VIVRTVLAGVHNIRSIRSLENVVEEKLAHGVDLVVAAVIAGFDEFANPAIAGWNLAMT
jgi:hypothetical protein